MQDRIFLHKQSKGKERLERDRAYASLQKERTRHPSGMQGLCQVDERERERVISGQQQWNEPGKDTGSD
jgi:hypothetical protein